MARALKTKSLTIRFSDEEKAFLEEQALLEDVSEATIVRRALREYAERVEASKPRKPKK